MLGVSAQAGAGWFSPDRLDAYGDWLTWGIYLTLSVVGWTLAVKRTWRLAVLRFLTPRVSLWTSRWIERVLFHRFFWILIRCTSMFAVILLLGSAVMFAVERHVNDKFKTLEEASHSTLIYLFSNVEDRQPLTAWGWRCFTVMVLCGLGLTAYVTGQFVREIMGRGRGTMESNVAGDGFLIIGWNARAKWIVEELFRAFEVGVEKHLITVLSSHKVDTAQMPELDSRGVTFVCGDAFDKKVLERIGAHLARSVVIMADRKTEDPDAETALTVLALRGLCDARGIPPQKRPRICVEVVNHRKTGLIRDAGADETVCHEDYGLGVLTQASFSESIAKVYQDLLSCDRTTNEIFQLRSPRPDGSGDIPADVWDRLFEGKNFYDAATHFVITRTTRLPVILVGLSRGNQVLVNPREEVTLQRGDDLMVVAWEKPTPAQMRTLMK